MEELIVDKRGKRVQNNKKKKNKRLRLLIICTIIIIITLIGTIVVINKLNSNEVKVSTSNGTSTVEEKYTENEVVSNNNTLANKISKSDILIVNICLMI